MAQLPLTPLFLRAACAAAARQEYSTHTHRSDLPSANQGNTPYPVRKSPFKARTAQPPSPHPISNASARSWQKISPFLRYQAATAQNAALPARHRQQPPRGLGNPARQTGCHAGKKTALSSGVAHFGEASFARFPAPTRPSCMPETRIRPAQNLTDRREHDRTKPLEACPPDNTHAPAGPASSLRQAYHPLCKGQSPPFPCVSRFLTVGVAVHPLPSQRADSHTSVTDPTLADRRAFW